MSATILITGASGFLARHLAEKLSLRHRILACSRYELNVLDFEAIEVYWKKNPEIGLVIHCATIGGRRTTNYDNGRGDVVEQNLRMFFNLARCLRSDQRLIHFGSGAEYARKNIQPKVPEDFFDKHVPEDSYGFSKMLISKYITHAENVLCLRVFGAYGKYDDYRYKFISNAIVKGLLGLPITIAQNVVFDYLYIDDFVQLVDKMFDVVWPYRHMNITPSESIDLLSIARIVNQVTKNTAGINVLNSGLNTEYTGDNKRLLQVAGPFSFTPYEQGIRELTQYYRSVWNSIDFDAVRADPYIDKCAVRL